MPKYASWSAGRAPSPVRGRRECGCRRARPPPVRRAVRAAGPVAHASRPGRTTPRRASARGASMSAAAIAGRVARSSRRRARGCPDRSGSATRARRLSSARQASAGAGGHAAAICRRASSKSRHEGWCRRRRSSRAASVSAPSAGPTSAATRRAECGTATSRHHLSGL